MLICVFEGYVRTYTRMYIVITTVHRHKGPIAGGGMLSGECPLCTGVRSCDVSPTLLLMCPTRGGEETVGRGHRPRD